MKESIKIYVDGTDWAHEIGETDVVVWPSLESMLRLVPCVKECGVLECTITKGEWVRVPSLEGSKLSAEERCRIYEEHIKYYEEKIERYRRVIERIKSEG